MTTKQIKEVCCRILEATDYDVVVTESSTRVDCGQSTPLNYETLLKLSQEFGTTAINIDYDSGGGGGCPTCNGGPELAVVIGVGADDYAGW